MRDSSFQRAAETNRWWTEWHEDEWRKRSYTVPLYLPNAAVLKQRQAQWGHEQRPRKTRTLGLDKSIVIKEVKQDNALREENSEILRPCRKLRRNLAIIRSMFPCWIQKNPPKHARGFLQLQWVFSKCGFSAVVETQSKNDWHFVLTFLFVGLWLSNNKHFYWYYQACTHSLGRNRFYEGSFSEFCTDFHSQSQPAVI